MASTLPKSFRQIVAHTLSADFRAATKIVTQDMPTSIEPSQVLVRNVWAGINASDINFTAGRYLPGATPPLYPGFEAVGEVVKAGDGVQGFSEGAAVAVTGFGCFSEYMVVPAKKVIPLPAVDPSFIPLMVSGLTASIALEQVGHLGSGETVMVTAAAGSTGQYAVQLAKAAGNHVIGTCSSDAKADWLRKLGCDRVINYKTEDVKAVLCEEYPRGIDLVYESVGGTMFETCVDALAVGGRLVVIGFISGYKDQSGWVKGEAKRDGDAAEDTETKEEVAPLPVKLLAKSASVRGFFLNNFAKLWAPHLKNLGNMVMNGQLSDGLDHNAKFEGLESCADAIDYLYNGKNMGKVVVNIAAGEKPRSKL